MARSKEVNGSRFIKFRVSNKMYMLIKEVANRLGISISETCRSALYIFFMSLFTGKKEEIEKEFWRYYESKKTTRNSV